MSVSYQRTAHGFRYRFLDATVRDSYETAVAQLQPGEALYRMMTGRHQVAGEPFPILIENKVNFYQSVGNVTLKRWDFRLAAGIPADQ